MYSLFSNNPVSYYSFQLQLRLPVLIDGCHGSGNFYDWHLLCLRQGSWIVDDQLTAKSRITGMTRQRHGHMCLINKHSHGQSSIKPRKPSNRRQWWLRLRDHDRDKGWCSWHLRWLSQGWSWQWGKLWTNWTGRWMNFCNGYPGWRKATRIENWRISDRWWRCGYMTNIRRGRFPRRTWSVNFDQMIHGITMGTGVNDNLSRSMYAEGTDVTAKIHKGVHVSAWGDVP